VVVFGATLALSMRGGEQVGEMLHHVAVYFPGYTVTATGAVIGAAYTFVLGLVLGHAVALVYNATVARAEERVARA
jgi:hypothetical protein